MLAQFPHEKCITNKWRHIREGDLRCQLRQLSYLNKQPVHRDPHFHQHVHLLLLLLQNSATTLIMRAEDFMELNTIICPISRATSTTLSTKPNPAAPKLQLGAPPHIKPKVKILKKKKKKKQLKKTPKLTITPNKIN